MPLVGLFCVYTRSLLTLVQTSGMLNVLAPLHALMARGAETAKEKQVSFASILGLF